MALRSNLHEQAVIHLSQVDVGLSPQDLHLHSKAQVYLHPLLKSIGYRSPAQHYHMSTTVKFAGGSEAFCFCALEQERERPPCLLAI